MLIFILMIILKIANDLEIPDICTYRQIMVFLGQVVNTAVVSQNEQ